MMMKRHDHLELDAAAPGRSHRTGFGRSHSRPGLLRGLLAALLLVVPLSAQEGAKGGVRGVVYDADFDVPVPEVSVAIPELGLRIAGSADGHFLVPDLAPGAYTLVFSKEGFQREVRAGVVVTAGVLTELDLRLAGEYTEMDEVVVSDLEVGGEGDGAKDVLQIRQQSAAVMDSIGSELIGKAGQSTVAGALRLVAGASVADGKYAVIRGLGDRYTSTQVNSVRLPSADPEKRAVQLDMFPSALVESIQVSKTFMPDQQADAGAGAINIVTRSVPKEPVYSFKVSQAWRDGITGQDTFLWNDRKVNYWGDHPERDLAVRSIDIPQVSANADLDGTVSEKEQELDALTHSLSPIVGPTRKAPPPDHGWSFTVGDFWDIGDLARVGGLFSMTYSRKYEGYNGGLRGSAKIVPETTTPPQVPPYTTEDLGVERLLWGRIATLGIEIADSQELGVSYLYNRAADNFSEWRTTPFYEPDANGYLVPVDGPATMRVTLDYLERTLDSLQYHGRHELSFLDGASWGDLLTLDAPVFSWTGAESSSTLFEPDRTVTSASVTNDVPGEMSLWVDPQCSRQWYRIDERSRQYFWDLEFPFETSSGNDGRLKVGHFLDRVNRTFESDYVNMVLPPGDVVTATGESLNYATEVDKYAPVPGLTYADGTASYRGNDPIWDTLYGENIGLLTESGHPYADLMGMTIVSGTFQGQGPVDYTGYQALDASYWMLDAPLFSWLSFICGTRVESTLLETVVDVQAVDDTVEQNSLNVFRLVTETNETGEVNSYLRSFAVHESEAGASLDQVDVLPAAGLILKPDKEVFIRLNWSQTIARPTFKELVPVQTPVYGSSDVFIGNADIAISQMRNWDLRLEWFRRPSDLLAVSMFRKEIDDVIDRTLLQLTTDTYAIFPINYPSAELSGLEFEWRQGMDLVAEWLGGFTFTYNYTRLWSEVQYGQQETDAVAPYSGNDSRPMQSQPDQLANIGITFEDDHHGVSANLFWSYTGRMLVTGESATDTAYTPSVYQEPSTGLTLSLSKTLFENITLGLSMKTPLQAESEQYYELGDERWLRTRKSNSAEYGISLSAKF